MGGETRRSSFGGPKVTVEELTKEGGYLDKALAFSKPSELPLGNPFEVSFDKSDDVFARSRLPPEMLGSKHPIGQN